MKKYRFIYRQNKEIKCIDLMLNGINEATAMAVQIQQQNMVKCCIFRVKLFEVISDHEVKFIYEIY